jgi:insulysin
MINIFSPRRLSLSLIQFIILLLAVPSNQFSVMHESVSRSGRPFAQQQALQAEKGSGSPHDKDISALFTRRQVLGSAGVLAASASVEKNSARAETATASLPRGVTIEDRVELLQGDKRQYRQVTYASGFRALLVSDPDSVECEVALRVGGNAGQLADPPDLPGLAHLTEHLVLSQPSRVDGLDLETWLTGKLYSFDLTMFGRGINIESNQRDGECNGFTGFDETTFHASAATPALLETNGLLRRFGGLFTLEFGQRKQTVPKQSIVDREVKRVEYELSGLRESIGAKVLRSMQGRAQLGSPWARFGRGSAKTLQAQREIDLAARSAAFRSNHYKQANMDLTVVGSEPLDKLQKELFQSFPPNSEIKHDSDDGQSQRIYDLLPSFNSPSRDTSVLEAMILEGGKKPSNGAGAATMFITWPVSLDESYGGNLRSEIDFAKVDLFAAFLLGHRGHNGSLTARLARRGWVADNFGASAGIQCRTRLRTRSTLFPELSIALTEEGLKHWGEVVELVCVQLELLSARLGPKSGTSYPYLEFASTAELVSWRYAPRPPTAVELVAASRRFPLLQRVSGPRTVFGDSGGEHNAESRLLESSAREGTNAAHRWLSLLSQTTPLVTVVVDELGRVPATPSFKHGSVEVDPYLDYQFTRVQYGTIDPGEFSRPRFDPLPPPNRYAPIGPGSHPMIPYDVSETPTQSILWRGVTRAQGQQGASSVIFRPDCLSTFLGGARGHNGQTCMPNLPFGVVVVLLQSPRPRDAVVNNEYDAAASANLWKASLVRFLEQIAFAAATVGLKYSIDFCEEGVRICFIGYASSGQALGNFAATIIADIISQDAPSKCDSESWQSLQASVLRSNAMGARTAGLRDKQQMESAIMAATPASAMKESEALFSSVTASKIIIGGNLKVTQAFEIAEAVDASIYASLPKTSENGPSVETSDVTESATEDEADVKDESLTYRPVWQPAAAQDMCLVSGVAGLLCTCGQSQ